MEQYVFKVDMVPEPSRNYIKNATDKNGKLSSMKLRYMPPDFKQWFEDNKSFMSPRALFNLMKNNLEHIPFCEYCHKVQLTPQQYEKGHYYCCNKHAQLDSKTKKKITKAFEKYEGGHPLRDSKVRKKIDKTNMERYGTTIPMNSPVMQKQIRENCLNEYGVDHPMKRQDVIAKRVDSYKQNCKKKYGVENTSQLPETKRKISSSKRKSCWSIVQRTAEINNMEILSTFDNYIQNNNFLYRCKKCNSVFEMDLRPGHAICRTCNPKHEFVSNKERSVAEWIESIYSGTVITSDRTMIAPYELDIYIPERKLAIEFDGAYWHSEKFKNKDYHQHKSLLCMKKDIRLIHIPELIWEYKQDIIKSIIENALGIFHQRIFARKCSVKTISSNEYKNFLEENHIQGAINSKHKYGLFHNNELVAVIGYGASRFVKGENELHRFCIKKGFNIPGAFSKLLKHSGFHGSSYIDLNYFNGSGYLKNNFKFVKTTEPNYIWINPETGQTYSRYQTQKHKLSKLLKYFDSELSETQNMELHGFTKIYDAGNMKVEL